jgi:hypothetical protein
MLQSRAIRSRDFEVSTTSITSMSPSATRETSDQVDREVPPTQLSLENSNLATSTVVQTTRKSKRKVKFADEEEDKSSLRNVKLAATTNICADRSTMGPSIDLCALQNACHYLRQNCGCIDQSSLNTCIAFFQKPKLSRYIFYISKTYATDQPLTNWIDKNGCIHAEIHAERA